MKAILFLLSVTAACLSLEGAEIKPIHKLPANERAARQQADAAAVLVHRAGLSNVMVFVDQQTELFPITKPKAVRLLRREEKEVVWQTWQRFLDYTLVLDSTERYHADWWRLKGDAREDSFLISYAAMLANYRAALEFIRAAEQNPELDKVLNDAMPELGMPTGTYAKLKFENLNVRIATEFAASEVTLKTFTDGRRPELRAAIKADADYIWKAGRGKAELLTAKNALKILEHGAGASWLPIQAGVSEWMGDTKVYRVNQSLITETQIEALKSKLQPGDVLLERREWFLSNIGLPGFWPHAALYIGTAAERKAFFADAEVQAWVKGQGEASGDFNALLLARAPQAFTNSITLQEHEHVVRVLEAMSEGVSFTTLEHSASCDALALLRPKLAKIEKARAILKAFQYAGRPYDFNFDFSTDAELVCTELVYKAYEPANGYQGLKLPTVEMLGRQVTPANLFAKQFDAQVAEGKEQFEMIEFLDGHERAKVAQSSSLAEFRSSWKRPKWHVLTR
ncbi:MAG: YiiX/YebB-like N1pC/P60 family cysteine hydrolase [Verrucomicrobiota bacterium]